MNGKNERGNVFRSFFDGNHVKTQLAVLTGTGLTFMQVGDVVLKCFQIGSAGICFAYGAVKFYRYWKSKSL